ncbi:Gfo/Idh/MocA family protein [Synechococcus sp. PCC 7336]|uniref:Gfo/Idh/MocA family protein n=1 Tax=Synechococcus sp. PCC 7336 TaxID=195250 RepID=UPI0003787373|nr:Gfo/Idh/MocA family oxidoreductase [Synechococcus sp. PCC 7336]
MPDTDTLRIVLIGFGAAGQRFAKVLKYIADRDRSDIKVVGVCDRRPEALAGSASMGWPCYDNLDTAIAAARPNVAIVTVNEAEHHNVLARLGTFETIERVLCEKPLTQTLSEAESLSEVFQHRHLSVNLVERYSPIIDRFFEWRREHPGLKPTRVQFFWGKHRALDSRPTIGVLSEMIHPLDLVDYIFGFPRWQVKQCFAHVSNFAVGDRCLYDSIHGILATEDYIVSAHTSFIWHERRREIIAFLQDENSEIFQVIFRFDCPLWDCDTITVYSINPLDGSRKGVLNYQTDNSDFPQPLYQVHKVYQFLLDGLGKQDPSLSRKQRVDYTQAVKLQQLLEDIDNFLKHTESTVAETIFGTPTVSRKS